MSNGNYCAAKIFSMKNQNNRGNSAVVILVVLGVLMLFGGIGGCMWGWPTYNVYRQKMEGQAILAHAQSSREVAVAEARIAIIKAKKR